MPRTARVPSATGIYHVVLWGVNRQDFLSEGDRTKYLSILRECRERSGFTLYGYCLTSDRIHLLLRVGEESISTVFRRVSNRFVYWYNLRHGRTGALFQGRYGSEPVEDESRFLAVLRYIHRIPSCLGLEERPGSYRWSSYFSYAAWPDGLTDTQYALRMFPSRDDLLSFFAEGNTDRALDMPMERRAGMTDEEAAAIMRSVTGCRGPAQFRGLDRPTQKKHLRAMSRLGLSLRQMAELTGFSRTSILRMRREEP